MHDASPTARALLVLELVQNAPGIRAEQLADRLGLSDRAIRRQVAALREAGIPVESTRGRYGGYRIGRGHRVPPLMFTAAEALGLVMAAVEGRGTPDVADPVGSALGKIIRVLPERVAGPCTRVSGRRPGADRGTGPGPRVRPAGGVGYRSASGRQMVMRVDPWAVVVRHGLWYLLCWSHTADARRLLRVDRVLEVRELAETFEAPEGLDPVRMLEEQLSQGWTYEIEVLIDAPVETVAHWIPRTIGRLEAVDEDHTRLVSSTDEPDWYAGMLAAVRAPFRVIRPPELREELARLGRRLTEAAAAGDLG